MLPTYEDAEFKRQVEIIADHGVARVIDGMDSEQGRATLERYIVEKLRSAGPDEVHEIITFCRTERDELTEGCLLDVATQYVHEKILSEHPFLEQYTLEVARRGRFTRGRGKSKWFTNWRRDVYIVGFTYLAAVEFALKPTRHKDYYGKMPWAASTVVSAALKRHGIELSEATIANIWTSRQAHAGPGTLALGNQMLAFAAARGMPLPKSRTRQFPG